MHRTVGARPAAPSRWAAHRRTPASGPTLAALTDGLGAGTDVAAITLEQLETLLDGRWADAAATTYNRHRAALVSFLGWCTKRGWAAGNVAVLVEPHKVRRRSEDA